MKRIKIVLWSILFLMLLPALQSCTGNHIDRTGFMPPVKIRIPNDVKKDAATVSFIKSSEKVINELSDRMENIAVNGKGLFGKNEQDMTMMDKIKMTKLSFQFLSAGTSLVNELDKIQHYVDTKEREGVSEADLKAYETVEKALEKRINALNNKYKDIIEH